MANDKYSQNRQLAYDLLKQEGYTDIGDNAEDLFKNKANGELAYKLLSEAGYTDIGKDYNEFAGMIYGPETNRKFAPVDSPVPAAPVHTEEEIASINQRRQDAAEGYAMFDKMRQSRKPANSPIPEEVMAAAYAPKPLPGTSMPVEDMDVPTMQAEIARLHSENDALISEYEDRTKRFHQDFDTTSKRHKEDEKWLRENKDAYQAAKDALASVGGRLNSETKEDNLERIAEKKRENQQRVAPIVTSSGGMAPGYNPADASKRANMPESEKFRAANDLLSQSEQTYRKGSKGEYGDNIVANALTAAKQFAIDGALNNIDMGTLTAGLSEGTSNILARDAMEKYNRIADEYAKSSGKSDDEINSIVNATRESAEKLNALGVDLEKQGAELTAMEETFNDMVRRKDPKAQSYAKELGRKIDAYNARINKEYEPMRAKYEESRGAYDELMSGLDAAVQEGMTDGERAILDAVEELTNANYARKDDVSIASAAGAGFEDTLEYMLDFFATGGFTKAGTKAATKLAASKLMKPLGKTGAKIAAKGLTDLGVAAARTAAVFPRNIQTYGEQLAETVGKDNLGRYQFDKNHLDAALNSTLTNFIGYWTEGFGEYLSAGEQALFREVTKAAPKTAVGKTLNRYRGSIGKYLDYGKFDGMLNEVAEEAFDSAFNALAGFATYDEETQKSRLGDKEALKQFASGEQLATLALSFLPLQAVSINTNMKAYNKMKQRYNHSVYMLNPYLRAGVIDRAELDELANSVADKTPEEIKDQMIAIADKARKKNNGQLPEDFTQNIMGYLEGTFALNLRNDAWEDSQEKMRVVNAYTDTYEAPNPAYAWDLAQSEEEARAEASAAGFSEDELEQDSYMLAQKAASLMEEQPERARALDAYATVKAAKSGLKDGYDNQTKEIIKGYDDAVLQNADLNGNVITATLPDGSPVYVTSKDADVTADGRVIVPTGEDGAVSYVDGNWQPHTAKASTLANAAKQDTETFLMDAEYELSNAREAAFQQAERTVSPAGQARRLADSIGQTVYVSGNGAYEPIQVVKMTNGGAKVVITGDKEALKGIASVFGIQSPGGTNLELNVEELYPLLATNDDGTLATSAPEGAPQAAPEATATEATAPTAQPEMNVEDLIGSYTTATVDGTPTNVFVEDVSGGVVRFNYEDAEGNPVNGQMTTAEFVEAMNGTQMPAPAEEAVAEETTAEAPVEAPVAEETAPAEEAAPVEEAPKIPLDKNGNPIYDAPGVSIEDALEDMYSYTEDGLSEADVDEYIINKAAEAEKGRDVKQGKMSLKEWAAKKKEANRIADFWAQLKELAEENKAAREQEQKEEAERQKNAEKYGVDVSTFDLTPRTMEEALAVELAGFLKGGFLNRDSVLNLIGKDKMPDMRKNGYAPRLSNKKEALPVDIFVREVSDKYPGYIRDEQDAINMVGDLLMGRTRKELSEFIFNNRLDEARKIAEEAEAPVAETPVEEEIPVAEAEAPAAEEETIEDLPEDLPEETVETAPAESETETEEVEETPAEQEEAVEEAPAENIEENSETASETEKESVNSQSVNETQEEAPATERELTEDEIRNSGYPDEDVIDAAIDYINGDRSISSTAAYNLVKEYVRPQRNATEQTRGDADGTQLDGPVVRPSGVGAERSGGESGELGGDQESGTAERVSGNPDGGVPAGEGSTASTTGVGQQSDVPDSGSNVRGGRGGSRKSGRPNADVPAENGTPSQSEQPAGRTEAGSTDIAALGGELEDLLKQFGETNYSIDRDINGLDSVSYSVEPEQKEEGELSRKQPKKPTVTLSFEGLTPKQMELAGKIIFSSAKLGYAFVKTEGLASFNDFRRWFKSKFGDAVMKGLNYDESSLDAFINEVWNTKLKIDGQRLTLAQHASELHNEELRKNSDLTPAERTRLQKEANEKKIPFKAADRKNIAEALPQLNPGQWDDLVAIERQFYDPSHNDYDHAFGKGMMITNGTGTGKTYTGLGTIKRFVDQGKGRILLVAPAGMTSEWVDKGNAMGIKMSKLADTKDKGEGVVVTSYQNFRENKALYEDDFDLVVYDESHNILENQQGDDTIAYEAHKRITNKNVDEALERLVSNTVPGRRRIELEQENKALEAEAKKKTTKQGRQIEIEMRQTEIAEEIERLNPVIEALKPQFRERAEKAVGKTKVLFLSATPFNTIENLKYAEGYIYQYPKVFRSDGTEITDEEGRKSAFVTEWFRGDEPMEEREIAFGDHLLDDLETVSYRELENGFDHSRDFPDVSGNIMASRFNFAFQSIMRNPKYTPLKKFAESLFGNSTWTTQLYETMKASALRDRLAEHLDAGRKIVIFHDRMHESKASDKLPAVGPPFQTILDMALMDKQSPIASIMAFKQEFADILKWEAGLDYRPVQEQVVDFYATDEDRAKFAKKMEQYEKKMDEWRKECDAYEKAHPNMEPEELFANLPKAPKRPQLEAESVAIYNGEKTDKEKEAAKAAFNDDNSKVKIICVTTRSGGAGLSLHDTTGKHPRVMIQTALPVSPIGFIQAEGRIFRWGNKSNAAFEYPRLGLDVEAMKFAMDFNAKAETVENLAHGFRGRGLKDSIMTGFYENSGNVPIAGQGIGGVEMDKRGNTLKGMAKAKHDYGVAQRKGIKAGDKSIPETIGYVLSGWGMMQSGDQALIPFAGRGSIARYMPKGVGVSALEQDIALQADLFVTAGGDDFKLKEGTFTELNPINKADVVILNGNTDGGLSQIETMRKGFLHLSEGGRLIAIVPNSEKEVEFTIKDLEGQGAVLRSTILVNNSAIDAGNDGVSRIIVVDKVSKPAMRSKAGAPTVHDLTKAEKEGVPALIEAIKMPERIIDKQAIAFKKIKTVLTEMRKNKMFGAINVYDENGARARVGFEMANRLPKGTNQSKYRFDSLSNRGFYYTGKWFQIPYSDFEKVNENNYLISAYQWLKEVVALPDDAFIRKAEIESNASKETIDAFRDMYRQYMKFIRAGFGLTEAQIQRVASGLQPDISAADIDTLNSYSELRAKFEAANHGDEERQDLYDKVAQVGEKIGLTIGSQSMDRDFLGGYNNKDNTLMVNKNRWNGLSDEKRAQTLLHEFIHSVTVYALAGYNANAAGMSDALFDSAKLAADVYDQITKGEAVDVRPFTGQYAIENEKELLAEMASSETKEKLQNRRMWVVRTPRGTRVSGSEMEGAEQTTAWNLLNEALDGMLKNFDKSMFDRFRGRVSDFFFELDRDGGYTRDADLGAADMRENGPVDKTVEDSIKSRAIADGTFMKAPNGKPSKLTEKQWLQVRTPAFKAWFGDWEIAAATTPIYQSKGTFNSLDEAENWAKENLQGQTRTNKLTGDDISIGRRSIKEMLGEKAVKGSESINAHLAALRSVLDFIETGIPGEIHEDTHGRGFDVMRLFNAIEIGGKLYRVKSTVRRVVTGDKYYTYEVQEMELMEERRANRESDEQGSVTTNNSNNSITGAKLLKGVKKTNSSEEILDCSKIVDENGEPLVVYHGTKRQFWAFDGGKSKGKFTDGLNYFALDRDFSERWIARDDAEWREPETNARLDEATEKRLAKSREVVAGIKEKYGDSVKYYETPEWKEFWDSHEEWEKENLGLDGMTLEDARYYLGNRILPVFINSRNPYNPTERYDSGGRQMLIDLGELSENPDKMDELYARGGSYIYYEKKKVVEELKKRGYDSIYLSENVSSDPSKNLRTIAVWDANRIKSATDNTGEFNPNNPDIRYREGTPEERRIVGAEIEATNKTLDRMGEALGIKINRVGSAEMPEGHQTAKGYYDPETGEMTICMDNVTDERDAIATVLHETVGHKGLRELFGNRFNEAMVNIYASLDNEGRTWVNAYIGRHNLQPGDEAIIVGMEEYMAHLAERGDFKKTVWERIKEILGKIVDLVFGTDGFVFTDRELNYILRASYEHLKNPDWLNTDEGRMLNDIWKRELGINETDPNKPTDPDGPGTGLRFRDGDTGLASENYNDRIATRKVAAITENQNADLPVKIGMDEVMKETGKKTLNEDEDYLMRHNQSSSRAESEFTNYELFKFTPLMQQVREIQSRLMNGRESEEARQRAYERILDYMYAVSGLERNAYKNGEIEQQKKDAIAKEKDPQKIAKITEKYDKMKKDWSGLTSLMHRSQAGWQDAENDARAMVADFEKEVESPAALKELWDRVRACTDFSLEHAYKHGLLTRDEFEKLHGTESKPRMWEYYLPLRGFSENTAEQEFSYSTFTNPPTNGVVVKKMKGRWTEADNPLANILNIAETEIVQGNDNWARQALYRFVLNAGKNSLLSMKEPWYVKDSVTGKWSMALPAEGETLEHFEEDMKNKRAKGEAKYGRTGLKLDNIMANNAHRNEHAIHVKVGGIDKIIWVNGNPAMAKAVTGFGKKQTYQMIRRASRVLSNLFTTYSLNFSVKNLIRDTIYSRIGLIVKEDGDYRKKFRKNWRANFGYGAFAYPMVRLAKMWETGELQSIPEDKRTTTQQMFIDFMMDGGQTGYTIINSVDEIKKSLEASMRQAGKEIKKAEFPIFGKKVPVFDAYAGFVKTLNEGFELLTRFTAYQTSRDMGRSGQRAAYDAKEISVNFNRRGAQTGEGVWGNIAAYLGATHYFYNAGVQGFDNFLRLFKADKKTMSKVVGGFVVMGILTPLINSMISGALGGGDDDWYWNLPEWVRRNNLILGLGNWYLAVPLPVEFRAPYGIGDIAAAAFCYQKTPNRKFGDVALDLISTASGILPVNPVEGYTSNGNLGDAALRMVAPDAGMFFVDWATNRDYTGRPLWKENPFSDTVPKSQGAYASTPRSIVIACQKLAEVSAGNIDIAPGLVRDFMNNYGGGFFRVAEDASKIVTGLIGNDPDRPLRYDNLPFFSGFTGHIDEDRSNSFVSNALNEYSEVSDGNVRKLNALLGTSDVTAAIAYDTPETLYDMATSTLQKARIKRILESPDYRIGKEYRDGMNNKYKMKQYERGEKKGQWYKSKEVERKGVNTLKKEWKDLREEWAAMPNNTAAEKSAKAEKLLEVQDAWHAYYDAQANLADELMNIEYGK